MSQKQKAKVGKRFLDFHIQTTSVNSGSQQYGAGLKMSGNSAGGGSSGGSDSQFKGGSIARSVGLKPKKTRGVQPGLGKNGTFPIISETEMIGTVLVPDDKFHVTNDFVVQPALDVDAGSCFRFVAPIAALYEKYELLSLRFTYKPLVSVFSDGGKAGQVVMSYVYDSLAGAPPDIITALATQPHVEGMGNQALNLQVDCREAMSGGKFTRNAVVPASDLKTYDAGRLFITVDGVPSTSQIIGQVIVSYTIRLLNPRPGGIVAAPPNLAFSAYRRNGVALTPSTVWYTPTGPWSTDAFTANPLGIVAVSGVAGGNLPGFTFPPGCWMVIAKFVSFNPGSTTSIRCSLVTSDDGGATWPTVANDYSGTSMNSVGDYAGAQITKIIHADSRNNVLSGRLDYYNAAAAGAPAVYMELYFVAA